ncbi:MAG: metallophosphoesterase [Thermodesulfovibrionales bacterium]|nr:metallophosphoesterase [Thermodesulfovibrionales bacterium]
MLIGIISDTHDDMEAIGKIVQIMNEKGVSHVIHAGDLISPFTFEVLGGLKAEFTGIYGNNDGDKPLLKEKSEGRIHNQPHMMTISGKNIVIVHEPDMAGALAQSGEFDLVIYGHSHTPDVRNVGSTMIINPGKAARLHKGKSTIALLDLSKMEAEIIEL